MIGRAIVVWVGLLAVAMAAAALREGLLTPRIGEAAAHVSGTVVVVAALLVVIGLSVRWVVPTLTSGRLVLLGVLWTALTVGFELAFGRLVVGHTWSRLLHDYDVLSGRVWILVPLTTLLGPLVLGRLRAGG